MKRRDVEIGLGQGGATAEGSRSASRPTTAGAWNMVARRDQAWRMEDLEKENLRLRHAISDLTLDKLIPQEAARKSNTMP